MSKSTQLTGTPAPDLALPPIPRARLARVTPADLQEIRRLRQWTVTEAAAALGTSGSSWHRWEHGRLGIHVAWHAVLRTMLEEARAAARAASQAAGVAQEGGTI